MARIPLQTANRNLDTGSVVQYPSGSPVGSARTGRQRTGDVAARFKQKQDQRDEFDANIVDSEFRATLPGVEDEAIRNAPADASGLHDGVYGQIDPSGKVAKPGSFDTLFDRFLERMPESSAPSSPPSGKSIERRARIGWPRPSMKANRPITTSRFRRFRTISSIPFQQQTLTMTSHLRRFGLKASR